MQAQTTTSVKAENKQIEFETTASYQVGKTKAIVTSVFRQDAPNTINDILARLICAEVEIN